MTENAQIIKAFEELIAGAMELLAIATGLETKQNTEQLTNARRELEQAVSNYNHKKDLILSKLEGNVITPEDILRVEEHIRKILAHKNEIGNMLNGKKREMQEELNSYMQENSIVTTYLDELKTYRNQLNGIHLENGVFNSTDVLNSLQNFLKGKDEIRKFITQLDSFKNLINKINEKIVDISQQQVTSQNAIQSSIKHIDRQIFHKHAGGNPNIAHDLDSLEKSYDKLSSEITKAKMILRQEERREYWDVIQKARDKLNTIEKDDSVTYGDLRGNVEKLLATYTEEDKKGYSDHTQKASAYNGFKGNLTKIIKKMDELFTLLRNVEARLDDLIERAIPAEVNEYLELFATAEEMEREIINLKNLMGINH